jgi:hypothetical protein
MEMESVEAYIKRCKEDIITDVFNIARLELHGAMIDEKGILNLISHSDVKDQVNFLKEKVIRNAKAVLMSIQP